MHEEGLSIEQLATIGRMSLFSTDDHSRQRMIAVAKGELDERKAFPRLLWLGGPNHGWLEVGPHVEGILRVFASGGTPAVGNRIHASPRYAIELMQHGFDKEKFSELGFRMEPVVYQLESLGYPIVARFLGWYGDLHDEHGNHIDPPAYKDE